jgi:hypothetical protein
MLSLTVPTETTAEVALLPALDFGLIYLQRAASGSVAEPSSGGASSSDRRFAFRGL